MRGKSSGPIVIIKLELLNTIPSGLGPLNQLHPLAGVPNIMIDPELFRIHSSEDLLRGQVIDSALEATSIQVHKLVEQSH